MNWTLNEEEIIDNLRVYRKNTPIFGMIFGNFEVIDSNEYVVANHSTQDPYIRCRCGICGKISLKRRSNLICGRYIGCSKCYENRYVKFDDVVSGVWVYDFRFSNWTLILANTECVGYLKTFGNWYINRDKGGYTRVVSNGIIDGNDSKTQITLARVIVDYINSKYNLPKLLDNQEIDHIDGNTFNNLYYPYDDYYNNLRVCTIQQNVLNEKCKGYVKRKTKKTSFQSWIRICGKPHVKTFESPEECIDYNNSLLSKSFPELAKYYYHHPDNPRNWSWTFSNTVLKAIGFNDDENINDEDFNEYEE